MSDRAHHCPAWRHPRCVQCHSILLQGCPVLRVYQLRAVPHRHWGPRLVAFDHLFICPCLTSVIAVYSTTEHFFQSQKFLGTPFVTYVRNANGPREAFKLARRGNLISLIFCNKSLILHICSRIKCLSPARLGPCEGRHHALRTTSKVFPARSFAAIACVDRQQRLSWAHSRRPLLGRWSGWIGPQ